MNYKLKQFIVWGFIAVVASFNLIIFGWVFKDAILSLFMKDLMTLEEIDERYLIESSLEHEIADFVQLFYNKQTKENDIFLIDHAILVKYIDEQESATLIERGYLAANVSLHSRNEQKKSSAVFGIFKSKIDKIQAKLVNLLSIGWKIKVVTANGKYMHTISPVEPLHLFFIKRSIVVQLVVFYPRNDYFWIGGFPSKATNMLNSEPWINQLDIVYGERSAIFDHIELSHHFMLTRPKEIVYFIMQLSTSKLIECNHTHADRFATLHGDSLYDSQELTIAKKTAIESIATMKELSLWLHSDIWLFNGALLSWFRNCGPFKHQYGLNFALSLDQVKGLNLTDELFRFIAHQKSDSLFKNGKLFVSEIVGHQQTGVVYRMQLIGKYMNSLSYIYLVLCYNNPNGTFSKRFLQLDSKDQTLESIYMHPRSELCSADYLGQKVLIPCKATETILNEFGPTWFVPAEEWDYVLSPFNRVNQSTLSSKNIWQFYDSPENSLLFSFCFYIVLISFVAFLFLRFQWWLKQKKHYL